MTEDEAKDWLKARCDEAQFTKLTAFVGLLLAEAAQQSLIARSTFDCIWARHVVDSAQLVRLAPPQGMWVDIGSGGGLPGLVVAILRTAPMTLVEPRRKRAAFLCSVADALKMGNVQVIAGKAETMEIAASIVSARAVAPIDDIFTWTRGNVSRETTYLLPRGRMAVRDMDVARLLWHGSFHVEQSVTDADAGILVARSVTPK